MIPVSLTLQGIYSYQQKQTIDFTRLTGGKLFGIFGPVGSGKSTILEAISYALHGETERLHSRDKRTYNMMNLKSNELFIDFIFKAGQNNDKYRFTVQGKRNKKNFERINTFERKGYRWSGGHWIPLESIQAENILGLSYENFKRTVIIPQGKFQEFLQLSETDRTRMLKEIFNLQRFELSEKVWQVEKQNIQEINQLEGELKGMEEITEEAKKEKVRNKNIKQQEKEKQEQLFKEVKKRFDHLQSLKDLYDHYLRARNTMADLKENKPEFDRRQKNVEQFEQCRQYFKGKIDRSNDLEKDIELRKEEIDKAQKQKDEKDHRINKHQKEFKQIQQTFRDEKSLDHSINDLSTIIKIRKFQEELAAFQKQLAEGEAKEEKEKKYRDQLKKEKTDLRKQIEEQKKKIPDQGKLGAVKNWYTQKNNTRENLETYEQESKKARDKIDDLKNQRQKILFNHKLDQLKDNLTGLPVKELQPTLNALKDEYDRATREIDEHLLHYQTRKELETYAQNLKNGEACPVCGSTEHPGKLQAGDADQHIKELQQKKKDHQNFVKSINQALQDLEGLKENYKNFKQQHEKYKEQYHKEHQKLDNHQQSFVWETYRGFTEQQVDDLLKQAGQQNEEIKQLEKQLHDKEQTLEEQDKSLEDVHKNNTDLKQKANSLDERIQSYKDQLWLLKFKDFESVEAEDLQNKLKDWQSKLQTYQDLEKKIEKLQKESEKLAYSINSQSRELTKKQKEKKQVSTDLKHQIQQSVYDNEGQIVKILEQKIDIEKEKKAIEEFQTLFNEKQGIYKNLEEQLKGKETFQQEAFEQVKTNKEKAEKEIQEFNNAIVILSKDIKDLEQKLVKKKQLSQKLENLNNRQENIRTLKNLFKGSGFVRYVSSVFLKELCHVANERFYSLTHQQLRLEVTGENNFQVRDFLNNGRVRSVKTLSGGQTFQAALSLALALSESIQQQNKTAQNFFFLDEGFGSLDRESLQTVFHTLKSLRRENRVVGVISHVEELQQEIDVSLNIRNDPEKGSLISRSWEIQKDNE